MNTPDHSPATPTVGPHDILFECPACGKSLVVDDSAENMVVPCPQCNASVIVPPREGFAPAPPLPAGHGTRPAGARMSPPPVVGAAPAPVPKQPTGPSPDALRERLTTLLHQLKEMQTQRTELSNRIASRLNEVNRDLVSLSRLEATQQQWVVEWMQLAGHLEVLLRDWPGERG